MGETKSSEFGSKFSSFSTLQHSPPISPERLSMYLNKSIKRDALPPILAVTRRIKPNATSLIPHVFMGESDLDITNDVYSSVEHEHWSPLYAVWEKKTRPPRGSNYTQISVTQRTPYIYSTRTYKTSAFTKVNLYDDTAYMNRLNQLYQDYNEGKYIRYHLKINGDFSTNYSSLDVRVGRVTYSKLHPETTKLYVCEVDVGIGYPLVAVANLGNKVNVRDMLLRWVIVVCNVESTIILGVKATAKIMFALGREAADPIYPPPNTIPGDFVTVRGYKRTPIKFLEERLRQYKNICVKFNTNNETLACYRGIPMEVEGKGFVYAKHLSHVLIG